MASVWVYTTLALNLYLSLTLSLTLTLTLVNNFNSIINIVNFCKLFVKMAIEYIDKTHAKLVVNFGSGKNRVRRVKRITYKGKKDAVRQYEEFKQSLTNPIDSDMTVEALLNWYIDSFEKSGGKPTTVRAYKVSSKTIIAYFRRFRAKDVKLCDVDTFIASETKIRSSKTIKNEISLLR